MATHNPPGLRKPLCGGVVAECYCRIKNSRGVFRNSRRGGEYGSENVVLIWLVGANFTSSLLPRSRRPQAWRLALAPAVVCTLLIADNACAYKNKRSPIHPYNIWKSCCTHLIMSFSFPLFVSSWVPQSYIASLAIMGRPIVSVANNIL